MSFQQVSPLRFCARGADYESAVPAFMQALVGGRSVGPPQRDVRAPRFFRRLSVATHHAGLFPDSCLEEEKPVRCNSDMVVIQSFADERAQKLLHRERVRELVQIEDRARTRLVRLDSTVSLRICARFAETGWRP